MDEEFEDKVLAAVNDLRAFGHHWVREPDDALLDVVAERLSGRVIGRICPDPWDEYVIYDVTDGGAVSEQKFTEIALRRLEHRNNPELGPEPKL